MKRLIGTILVAVATYTASHGEDGRLARMDVERDAGYARTL